MGKEKDEQSIMVVSREHLFGEANEHHFQGFSKGGDYEERILTNFQVQRRGPMETSPDFKQPIAYTLVANPELGKVFVYQREKKDQRYGEKRLQGKWTWGVGGHIDMQDIGPDIDNPIKVSLLRELQEEVRFVNGEHPTEKDVEVLGYINDDSDDVGKVHFGILYVAKTTANFVNRKDLEIAQGRLMKLGEIERILADPDCVVESWSQIAMDPLREYLARV